ncbi:MAG: DEAD/DEAH box helicase [Candidatus Magasanikbacteria bacterium]|nr:DEAD/DEAH box helicase [Candidatus Magasanikbacteria bacterium]
MTQPKLPSAASFDTLGIAPKLLAILAEQRYRAPTPIQHQAIPPALEGKDLIGIAQTGTGKTLAFGVPLIQRLAQIGGQGLIMLPTRELALQVEEMLQRIGRPLGLKTAVLIGGAPMHRQIQALRHTPHVLVATPGRLADHLQQKTVSLQQVKVVVLDEADRMLDIGFLPQIKQILNVTPRERQTMLFSATMPAEIAQLAGRYMRLPLRVEVAPAGTAAAQVEHEVFMIGKDAKLQLLEKLLAEYPGTILVFSRTKHGAKKITAAVRRLGHSAAELHSNRSLSQRRAALDGFKSGVYRVLVATDIAARGIDVVGISLVINYDLPDNSEDYVHRIGRTGRAGLTGKAISFATPDQRGDLKSIERLIRKTLPILALPVLPPRCSPPPAAFSDQAFRGRSPAPRHSRWGGRSGGFPRSRPRRSSGGGGRGWGGRGRRR